MGIKTTLSRVKSDIKKRDYEDTHRKISSLKPAKDAKQEGGIKKKIKVKKKEKKTS